MENMLKTFKFRLVPNKAQAVVFRRYIGASRWAWNRGLRYMQERYERGDRGQGKNGDYYSRKFKDGTETGYAFYGFKKSEDGLAAMWVHWKKEPEFVWLSEYYSDSVRNALMDLDKAWKAAKNRRYKLKLPPKEWGYPRRKKYGDGVSFTLPSGSYRLRDGRLYLGKKFGADGGVIVRPNRGRRKDPCGGYIPAAWLPQAKEFSEEGKTAEEIAKLRDKQRRDIALKTARIKEENGKFYLCVSAEYTGGMENAPHTGEAVGIDAGVAKSFTLSDGKVYDLPKHARLEARKRRYERIMARRRNAALFAAGWDGKSETRRAAEIRLGKKRGDMKELRDEWREKRERQLEEWKKECADAEMNGRATPKCPDCPPRLSRYSNRYELAKHRAAKTTTALKNVRKNWAHHITSEIVAKHGFIAVEGLQIKNMTKSAKGTADEPGKNVAQKTGLNRSILENGWGIAKAMLAYKTQFSGGRMEEIAAAYTSQQCAECGHSEKENRKTQERFKCVKCGHEDDADINAARNILVRGLGLMRESDGEAESGRGDSGVSRSVKRQSPIEQRGEIPAKRAAATPKMSDKTPKQSGITNRSG